MADREVGRYLCIRIAAALLLIRDEHPKTGLVSAQGAQTFGVGAAGCAGRGLMV
jgi:hypothetical protein